MSAAAVDINRCRFNHDILISRQADVEALWPRILPVIIDPDLQKLFTPHESNAKLYKRVLQWGGTIVIVLMVIGILGLVCKLAQFPISISIGVFEFCGLIGALSAYPVSQFSRIRRWWLTDRFVAENFRRWHFAQFLKIDDIVKSTESTAEKDRYNANRKKGLNLLRIALDGSTDQKMVRFAMDGDEVALTAKSEPPHVEPTEAVQQLLDAYLHLRIVHQLDFAVYKLSPADQTFCLLSLSLLCLVAQALAALFLGLATACSGA